MRRPAEAQRLEDAERMIVHGRPGQGVGCPACAKVIWPGALHLTDCPNKPKEGTP